MRRRTITLVVVGLVLALFVLPAAANEFLGEDDDVDEIDRPYLTYDYDEPSHVVFYGIEDRAVAPGEDEDPLLDCRIPDGVELAVTVDDDGVISYEIVPGEPDPDADPDAAPFELPEECIPVLIEGPNGQVNHGQFVSNMVHDLKEDYDKDVNGPFGQWVKLFAHDKEIGKGDLKVKANTDGDLSTTDADDLEAAGDESKPDKPDKGNKGNKENRGKKNG